MTVGDVLALKSLLSTLLPVRTQTEVQTAATTCSSCNWIRVLTDTFHIELYIHTHWGFFLRFPASTILFQGLFGDILLLFALDIIVLFSWTD